MTIGSMISRVVIGPLLLIYESVYAVCSRVLSAGGSLAALSLVSFLLLLPFSALAQRAGKSEGNPRKASRPRWMGRLIPILKDLLPLLLQLPFLWAGYAFLTRLGVLRGASWGPLSDLAEPDRLLHPGGAVLSLLPLLMTLFALASAWLQTRGKSVFCRVLYVCAHLIILIFFREAPSGFALFWTGNRLLSLGALLLSAARKQRQENPRVPRILRGSPHPAAFAGCALALAVLTGLLVPSTLLAASPQEFIYSIDTLPPVWQVVNTGLLAAGVFLFWAGLLYVLGTRPVRKSLELLFAVLLGVFLINDFFFRGGLGTISTSLQYDVPPEFSMAQKLLNLAVLAAASAGLIWLSVRKQNLIRMYALILAAALFGLSVWNVWTVHDASVRTYRMLSRNYEGSSEIPLSRKGKNVVVLMLDRAISSYLPCILQEMPELAEKYSGFTYYPNTLSFGMHTNLAAPALFGGYEYTPAGMNARPDTPLREKHNEALLLMPTLFQNQGYQVSVFDVPYPGDYSEAGDYSVFDHLSGANARIVHELDSGNGKWERLEDLLLRNLFCYSLTTCSPSFLYGTLYNMGNYNRAESTPSLLAVREIQPVYEDLDASPAFLADYEVLKNLREMTVIRETEPPCFLLMVNTMTHTPVLLKEPEYEPGFRVNNEEYDAAHQDRFLAGPLPLKAQNSLQMAHYHVNMAALRMVGDWLDLLKAEGVYDQTRIIIAADHGFWLRQIDEGILEDVDTTEDVMGYNPLLMVKDFGAEGPLRTDTGFMTNADVPALAVDALMENPVNGFTGRPLSGRDKEKTQYVSISHEAFVSSNHGNRFLPSKWYAVDPGGTTLFDLNRWHFVPDEADVPMN